MHVELLVRDYGRMIGLSRYNQSLCFALDQAGFGYDLVSPALPLPVRLAHRLLEPFHYNVQMFFENYPLSARVSKYAIKHLTAQDMGTLLWFTPHIHPCVITVHDIVPYLVRKDKTQQTFRHPFDHFFNRLAMLGLKRADALISISEFTKRTLIEALDITPEKIYVVYRDVNHQLFKPTIVPQSFLQKYDLHDHDRYILYVGSENPRKNLPRLIRVFGKLHSEMPDLRLIKVGTPESPSHAEQNRKLVGELGLEQAVYWLGSVPEEELPLFYNLADLFVFPSLYEGFGLPPLEAMACGAPVACSNAASLPEVVGQAALLFDPLDVDGMASAMQRILTGPSLSADLRRQGLERARAFTWERAARETLEVYRQIADF